MVMLMTTPASAYEEASGVPVEASEGTVGNEIADEGILGLEEEDLIISEEAAGYIAEFFIRDMIETGQTCWNDSTAIIETTLMYDETGDNVTGYTFKLSAGYIVVSAYVDLSNPILEWSDVAEPVYEDAEMDSGDKVVYLGALDYYIDTGEADLETVDGDTVPRDELSNGFEEQRSIENVDEELLSAIVEAKEEALSTPGISTFAADNNKGGYITDPITYAKNVYGGTWTANNWANYWENYAFYSKEDDFSGYGNHCGPIAITNIIKMYGEKYNHSKIKNSTKQDVFGEVMYANNKNFGLYFNSTDGTFRSTADAFIRDSFDVFDVTVRTFGRYAVNYQNTVNAVGSSNRLMYIAMNQGSNTPYTGKSGHAVVGFAYTRLMNSSGFGRAFIKICDGKNNSARYVEIDSIAGAEYWEVNFS